MDYGCNHRKVATFYDFKVNLWEVNCCVIISVDVCGSLQVWCLPICVLENIIDFFKMGSICALAIGSRLVSLTCLQQRRKRSNTPHKTQDVSCFAIFRTVASLGAVAQSTHQTSPPCAPQGHLGKYQLSAFTRSYVAEISSRCTFFLSFPPPTPKLHLSL